MKEILYNLALIDCTTFCRDHGIDCAGSHLVKYPRRFVYALVGDATGCAIVTVSFLKSGVPVRSVNPELVKH